MQEQVWIIHGGTTFDTYDEYLKYLQNKAVSLEDLTAENWKNTLAQELGAHYHVLAPRMPNPQNAKYREWRLWFTKFMPFVTDNAIFIGHSLGGLFVAKYLAEETLAQPLRATFLIAAPCREGANESLADFTLPDSLTKLQQQGGSIHLYHSQDDPVVPFSSLHDYQRSLPSATARAFTDRQHFRGEHLPELVEDIKKLAS